jgi:hypothetical protein
VSGEPSTFDGGRVSLKPAQEAALAELENGLPELTRAGYQEITGVSRSQAAYDLADLVTLGVLERVGQGRSTRYRLGRGAGGRARKWTNDRIRAGLEAFCSELGRWPRAVEFREAGHGDLYLAASRYGGIDYWAAELGFRENEPDETFSDDFDEPLDREGFRRSRGALVPTGVMWGRILLAGAVVVVAVAFATLIFLVDNGPTVVTAPSAERQVGAPNSNATGGEPAARAKPVARRKARVAATPVALRLSASGGSSWVAVRKGSADGDLLYQGTLAGARSRIFRADRLWLRLGAPANLRARLNGRLVDLPGRTATVLVTKRGIRVLKVAPPSPPPAPPPPPAPEAFFVSDTGAFNPPPPSSSSPPPPPPPPPPPSGPPTPDAPTGGGGGGTPSPDPPPPGP